MILTLTSAEVLTIFDAAGVATQAIKDGGCGDREELEDLLKKIEDLRANILRQARPQTAT